MGWGLAMKACYDRAAIMRDAHGARMDVRPLPVDGMGLRLGCGAMRRDGVAIPVFPIGGPKHERQDLWRKRASNPTFKSVCWPFCWLYRKSY